MWRRERESNPQPRQGRSLSRGVASPCCRLSMWSPRPDLNWALVRTKDACRTGGHLRGIGVCADGGTRTPSLDLRRVLLHPIELRRRGSPARTRTRTSGARSQCTTRCATGPCGLLEVRWFLHHRRACSTGRRTLGVTRYASVVTARSSSPPRATDGTRTRSLWRDKPAR